MNLINKEDAVFVAIDFQERLMPAMFDWENLQQTVVKLTKGIKVLDIPIIVTQQYTKGLGTTVAPIAEALGEFKAIEKNTFSAAAQPDFVQALTQTGKKSIILCGIEAHICVQQTALDLIESGYQIFVAADCIRSRKEMDNSISQNRMTAAGAVITTYESILYELLKGAKAEGFKAISAIVK